MPSVVHIIHEKDDKSSFINNWSHVLITITHENNSGLNEKAIYTMTLKKREVHGIKKTTLKITNLLKVFVDPCTTYAIWDRHYVVKSIWTPQERTKWDGKMGHVAIIFFLLNRRPLLWETFFFHYHPHGKKSSARARGS